MSNLRCVDPVPEQISIACAPGSSPDLRGVRGSKGAAPSGSSVPSTGRETALEHLPLSSSALEGLLMDVLQRGASCRFKARGSSMHPFIHNGDFVTVSRASSRDLVPGDIVAFSHPLTSKLTVHRIVEWTKNGLVVQGDNAENADGFVPLAKVLGVVTKVERNGNPVSLGLGQERHMIAFLLRRRVLRRVIAGMRPFKWVLIRSAAG